jgi:type IV pilus assembly protein PilX
MAAAINNSSRSQRGVALFLALVVLLIITVLGVSGLQTTTLEERMAANARDRDLAFQAAEAALIDAERFLNSAVLGEFANNNGRYLLNSVRIPIWHGNNRREGEGGVITFSVNRPGAGAQAAPIPTVVRQPEYFIEQFPATLPPGGSLEAGVPADEIAFFRVTARGFGGRENTVVVLQTGFQR